MAEVAEQETGFKIGQEYPGGTDLPPVEVELKEEQPEAGDAKPEEVKDEAQKPEEKPAEAEKPTEEEQKIVTEQVAEKPQEVDFSEKINQAVSEASGGELESFDSLIENYNELIEFHEKYSKLEEDEITTSASGILMDETAQGIRHNQY